MFYDQFLGVQGFFGLGLVWFGLLEAVMKKTCFQQE